MKATFPFILYTILLLSILFLNGCAKEQQPIGGDKDEYGCLVGAGYSWDENISACTRPWEIQNEDQKIAAMIAVKEVGPEYGLTIKIVEDQKCSGCYIVYITREEEEETSVQLKNWKVFDEQEIKETYCEQDQDCGCGTHIETGDCFYGNVKYVDQSTQCSDFCAGIGGNLEVSCVENQCIQTFRKINNFKACETAGFPVMESYPRQCKAGTTTFVEDISDEQNFN